MLGLILPLAYALDILFGDPVYSFHPVRLIGRMAESYERKLRGFMMDEVRGGLFLAFGLPLDVFIITVFILWVAGQVHPLLQFVLSTFFIYSILSVRDMDDHAKLVKASLERGDLAEARLHLSKMVGRDTAHLDQKEIVKATVETIAEGTLDGIISPLIYASVGGAPLAMVFKAVNTLDSMVGYQNEQYEKFGRFSAKFDDILNYIPARISPLLISLGAFMTGLDGWKALRVGIRDGGKHTSLNSGFPEASYAGALGAKLGGLSYYQGKPVDKPYLYIEGREAGIEDIGNAVRLMYFSSFFAFLFAMLVWYVGWLIMTMDLGSDAE